jgi:hypothetical protein
MIKATKDGRTGIFSDIDWKSGQPQRYGWREEGKEAKTLPKEIIQFIERKAQAPVKVEKPEVKPVETTIPEAVKVEKVTKPKIKKNDNPKQKGRTPGKHKPGSVEKA